MGSIFVSHTTSYRKVLCINSYEQCLKAIYHWLGNYELNQICTVIEGRKGQETPFILSQRLVILNGGMHHEIITDDPYTPKDLQNKTQDLSAYDELLKKGGPSYGIR